jgi:hypothetical protein
MTPPEDEMSSGKRVALVTMTLVALAQPVAAGNLNAVFGYRTLDTEVWEPMDSHQAIGFDYEHALKAFHVTFGLHISSSSDRDDEGNLVHDMSIAELTFGLKKLWKAGRSTRPYLGGGVSWIWNAHFEIDPIRPEYVINDSSVGYFVNAGVLWRVGRRCNLGADIRVMRGAEVTFTQREGSLDYEQIGVLAGFNWGRDRDR